VTDEWNGLRRAVAFLTPIGGAVAPGPDALFWFPAVGAVLGLGVGAVWWGASRIWGPLLGAALAVSADLAFTGMLHLDGLCDSSDGLIAPLDRSRRLEVMAAHDTGAFAVGVACLTLLVRVGCLAALHPSGVLVAALWTGSRTVMAVVAVGVPYARPGGLASGFIAGWSRRGLAPLAVAGAGGALVLALVWRPVIGPLAIVGLVGGAGAVVGLAWRRIGGYTGDVLGAAGMIGETVGLLVAAARW
jgi:adenosylcobinamide-GDP ribazoletransferase